MKPAAILVVVLSHQGYWFGGQAGRVSVRWAVKDDLPESVLVWDLMFGSVRMAGDRVAVRPNDRPSVIEITPPEVRVRTTMRWVYRLQRRDGGEELARGEAPLHVFPAGLLTNVYEDPNERSIKCIWRPRGAASLVHSTARHCARHHYA